uniref:WD repeat-containing protein 20 n=1 Tax=Rhizophora mucronata TaxID=61149 RepID=A0A2P2J896_RHIMU
MSFTCSLPLNVFVLSNHPSIPITFLEQGWRR